MSKSFTDALPSPAARRLAAATGATAHQIPLKLQHTLTKADRSRSRYALLVGWLCLTFVGLAAALLTSLPRLGPSPLYAAAGVASSAFTIVPDLRTVASDVTSPINVATPTQTETADGVAKPAAVAANLSTPSTVNSPRATEAALPGQQPKAAEPIDADKVVAPIAQKIQSLEERLAALNLAAESERREAEKRAIDRREQERRDAEQRDIERRQAEQRLAEQRLAEQQLIEQRVAANQPSAGLASSPSSVSGTTSGQAAPCLAAVDAASQAILISFDTGSTVVSPVQVEQLKRFAVVLKNCPPAFIEVSGHTDTVGALESNFSLSWRRAEAVIAVFQSAGVDPSRFTAVGFGTRRPLSQAAGQQNPIDRRVELKLR